jgi:lipopolysaccharide export system permease protein
VIIFRYLARELLVSMTAVTLALMLIFMSSRFVKYLAQAASGEIAGRILLPILFYRLPAFLELILPLGLFLGIMLSYGRLYVESEMIVMNACGVSKRRLLTYTLVPALGIALVAGTLSLYLTPLGWQKFYALWDDPQNMQGLSTMVPGRFQGARGDNMITYAERIEKDTKQMYNVFIALPVTKPGRSKTYALVYAERGRVVMLQDERRRFIELENGYRFEGNPGELKYTVMQFERYRALLDDEPFVASTSETDARTTAELIGSKNPEDIAALQWRTSLPLLVPIVALIALALSETSHRRGRFIKMLPALLIYIFYLIILSTARSWLEKGRLPTVPGIYIVHVVFLLLGIALYFGPDVRRRWRRARSLRREAAAA